VCEQLEATHRDGREQAGLVPEVVRGRLPRDPDASRDRSQAQAVRTLCIDELECGFDQVTLEASSVVRTDRTAFPGSGDPTLLLLLPLSTDVSSDGGLSRADPGARVPHVLFPEV
jgi:hypothetical protein